MPSNQHLAYVTLDSIVNDFLLESEQGNNRYFKVWHLAFRGMEEMGLDFFYMIQTFKLPINANLTVTLPPNYMNWTKVGILNDEGGMIPLWHNNNLTSFADLMPDRIAKITDPQSLALEWGWDWNTWCNYWDGWSYVSVYGVPSGEPFVGSFKVDLSNGVILLSEHFNRDYIMLECVVSPIPKMGTDYYVPVQFKNALISYIRWMDALSGLGRSHYRNTAVIQLERMYFRDRRNAIARWKPIRLDEQYQTSQEMSRLAIKT